MAHGLKTVHPPPVLHRLVRGFEPWAYPSWALADPNGTFGNRWDDPSNVYRVLYACSERRGCFIEVLSRFRPDPAVADALANISGPDDSLPARTGSPPLAPRPLARTGSS